MSSFYDDRPRTRDDACCVCGSRHAPHRCDGCGLQLCALHRNCPECDEDGMGEPDDFEPDAIDFDY